MLNWMDRSIETSQLRKGRLKGPVRGPFDLVLWVIALEALVAFAKLAVRLMGLVCFHPVALVCFVTCDNTASCRSQNPVVSSNMPSDAADGSALRRPFASADVIVQAIIIAAHPISAFILASKFRLSVPIRADDNRSPYRPDVRNQRPPCRWTFPPAETWLVLRRPVEPTTQIGKWAGFGAPARVRPSDSPRTRLFVMRMETLRR